MPCQNLYRGRINFIFPPPKTCSTVFRGIYHAITPNNAKHGSLLRKMALLGPHLETWPYWCQILILSDMCKLPKNCMKNCTQHQNPIVEKKNKDKKTWPHKCLSLPVKCTLFLSACTHVKTVKQYLLPCQNLYYEKKSFSSCHPHDNMWTCWTRDAIFWQ